MANRPRRPRAYRSTAAQHAHAQPAEAAGLSQAQRRQPKTARTAAKANVIPAPQATSSTTVRAAVWGEAVARSGFANSPSGTEDASAQQARPPLPAAKRTGRPWRTHGGGLLGALVPPVRQAWTEGENGSTRVRAAQVCTLWRETRLSPCPSRPPRHRRPSPTRCSPLRRACQACGPTSLLSAARRRGDAPGALWRFEPASCSPRLTGASRSQASRSGRGRCLCRHADSPRRHTPAPVRAVCERRAREASVLATREAARVATRRGASRWPATELPEGRRRDGARHGPPVLQRRGAASRLGWQRVPSAPSGKSPCFDVRAGACA